MELARILAFDPGTAHTGYAMIEGKVNPLYAHISGHFGVVKTHIDDGTVRDRIDAIGEQMKELILVTSPHFIVIEDFTEQGVRSGTTYKEMSWLIEHMRMIARGRGHVATIFENGEWKKIATGSKGLNKDQVKHFVSHKVKGVEHLPKRTATHIWDSIAMAYAKLIQIQGE